MTFRKAFFSGLWVAALAVLMAVSTAIGQPPPPEDQCSGAIPIIIPPVGSEITPIDAQLYSYMTHTCDLCPDNGGRDVFFYFDLHAPTRLEISTCASGFNTYLCIFKGTCCESTPYLTNDYSTDVCGEGTTKAAVNACFPDTGRYYIALAGVRFAYGHYVLRVKNIYDPYCGPHPEFPCPEIYGRHEEVPGQTEAPCGFVTSASCDTGFCGIIEPEGDLDVYSFTITECKIVTLTVFADSTYGHWGYLEGLDPVLTLWAPPACDHVLYENDDYWGTLPAPLGRDSRIVTACLRPGTYEAQIGGKGTVGDYEFTIECAPCDPVSPLPSNAAETPPGSGKWCVSWTPLTGPNTYYVWRYYDGGWTLAGTSYKSPYCETFAGSPFYQVFADPCGKPMMPSR